MATRFSKFQSYQLTKESTSFNEISILHYLCFVATRARGFKINRLRYSICVGTNTVQF